jgi:putative hydrolase
LATTYKLLYDWHTHTTFSHGTGSVADNVRAAARLGLAGIGITDHGPGHAFFGLKRSQFAKLRAETEALKEQYPELEIFMGVEANTMSASGLLDLTPSDFAAFDYVIAGYHYGVFRGNFFALGLLHIENIIGGVCSPSKRLLVKNTEMIEKALHTNDIKMLTHPGDKGLVDIFAVARACAETDTLFEINARHKSLTVTGLKAAARSDAKFAVSSDAHSPEGVGDVRRAVDLILEAGLDTERVVNLQSVQESEGE